MTTRPLPRSTPEAEGLDPAAVRRLVRNLDELDAVHSFMLLRHGTVVAEGAWFPHQLENRRETFSVSKSFTSIAVGLAFVDGLLDLDDKVLDHLADDAPESPSDNLRALTIRHLLTMSTGHDASTIEASVATNLGLPSGNWARQILAAPVPHPPGERFVYNTGATYLAGVIVQRLTGRRLLDYLDERILGPLGIEGATWQQDPDGLDVGGYGLSLRTEDLARFGQFCLQAGSWDDEQLLPGEWIEAATSRQIDTTHDWREWQQGYGFQFWRSRFGAFRADGAFGQYAIVWPEHDVVVAITSGIADLQSVQDAVWDALLPDLDPFSAGKLGLPQVGDRPEPSDRPDPGPRPAEARPADALSAGVVPPEDGVAWDLRLPLPDGRPTTPDIPMLGRTYRMSSNDAGLEAIELVLDADGHLVLREEIRGADRVITLGHGEWLRQRLDLAGGRIEAACAAAWPRPNVLEARMVSMNSPFIWTLTLRFDDDVVTARLDLNVSFGETNLLDVTGRAA